MTSAERRLVAAGPSEQQEFDRLARTVIGHHPSVEAPVTRIVERFVRETGAARRRVATAGPGDPVQAARPTASSPVLSVIGYALLGITLLTSLAAAAALLPPRRGVDVEPEVLLALSSWSAWIAASSALAGALLPAWGGAEIRRQGWQVHVACVICILGGLAWSSPRVGELAEDAGAELVVAWVTANGAAIAALVIGGLVRYLRRGVVEPTVRPPDADRLYRAEIAASRTRAASALTELLGQHPESASSMQREWVAAIADARRAKRVTPRSASRARGASAWLWYLEAAADPDYGA